MPWHLCGHPSLDRGTLVLYPQFRRCIIRSSGQPAAKTPVLSKPGQTQLAGMAYLRDAPKISIGCPPAAAAPERPNAGSFRDACRKAIRNGDISAQLTVDLQPPLQASTTSSSKCVISAKLQNAGAFKGRIGISSRSLFRLSASASPQHGRTASGNHATGQANVI